MERNNGLFILMLTVVALAFLIALSQTGYLISDVKLVGEDSKLSDTIGVKSATDRSELLSEETLNQKVEKPSENLSVLSGSAPSITSIVLNSSSNHFMDSDNLTCYASVSDPENDNVNTTYSWIKNGVPYANLVMSFDAHTNNPIRDYSGYVGTAGQTTAYWIQDGKVGGAFRFDGNAGQYGVITNDLGRPYLDVTGTGMAVELWVNSSHVLTAPNQRMNFIQQYNGVSTSYALGAFFDPLASNTRLNFSIATNVGIYSVASLSPSANYLDGNWHHVVGVYDGTNIILYIDGVENSRSSATGSIITSGGVPAELGLNYLPYVQYFYGDIDEVRLYNHSLSAEQIAERYSDTVGGNSRVSTISNVETAVGNNWRCNATASDSTSYSSISLSSTETIVADFNVPPVVNSVVLNSSYGYNSNIENLTCYASSSDYGSTPANTYKWTLNGLPYAVGLYSFDTDLGGIVEDYSGNGYNLSAYSPTWISAGKIGGAYNFSGSSQYILSPAQVEGTIQNNQMAVEAWILPYTSGTIIDKELHATNEQYSFYITSDDKLQFELCNLDSCYNATSTSTISYGDWHHVAGVYDIDGNLKVYIDGTQDGALVPTTGSNVNSAGYTGNLWIGFDVIKNVYFTGTIDELKIYNHSLSAEQINADYTQTVSGDSNKEMIVNGSSLVAGDTLQCEVTASDGSTDSSAVLSSPITILTGDADGDGFGYWEDCNDNNATIRPIHNSTDTWNYESIDGDIFLCPGTYNATIETTGTAGISIDCNGATLIDGTSSNDGIDYYSSGGVISNCNFIDFSTAVYVSDQAIIKDSVITGVNASDTYGIFLESFVQDVVISNVNMSNLTKGVYLIGGNANTSVVNSTMNDTITGVDAATSDHVKIDNVLIKTSGTGLSFDVCNNASVLNSIFSNVNEGIFLTQGVDDIFTDNLFENSLTGMNVNNAICSGTPPPCALHGTSGSCNAASGCHWQSLTHQCVGTATPCSSYGVSSCGSIIGCGLSTSPDYVYLVNPEFSNVATGVIGTSNKQLNITKPLVYDNVSLNVTDLNVISTLTYKNSIDSLNIDGKIYVNTGATIDNAKIEFTCGSAGECGIDMASDASLFINNSIITGSNNYFFEGQGTVIADNSIFDNGYSGMHFYPTASVRIQNSNITNTLSNGIFLESDNSIITNNQIIGNSETGIYVVSDNNNISGNNISFNSPYGLDLSGSSNYPMVGNAFSGNSVWDFVSESDSSNNVMINMKTNSSNISFTYVGDISVIGSDGSDSPSAPYGNISHYVNITNNSAGASIYLNISYDDSDLIGTGISESALKLYRNSSGQWTNAIGNINGVDMVNNVVYANISSFGSVFAPLGFVTELNNCAELDVAGTTYHLVDNVTHSSGNKCFNITADNVTLDCQGHTVTGTLGTGYSVYANGYNNLKIYNCTFYNESGSIYLVGSNNSNISYNRILDYHFDGITSRNSYNNSVEHNVINNSQDILSGADAMYLPYANNITVRFNDLMNSSEAIYVQSVNSEISWNTITTSDVDSIMLDHSAGTLVANNTVINSDISSADLTTAGGISVYYSNNTSIYNNTVRDGSKFGINAYNSKNITIRLNNVHDNAHNGIYLTASNGSAFSLNNVYSNGNNGIVLENSGNSTLISNNVYNNSNSGVSLSYSGNSTINLNNVSSNAGSGIYLVQSGNSTVNSNNIYSNTNTGSGINLASSRNNTVNSNNIYNNSNVGVYLSTSGDTILSSNNLYNNSNYGVYVYRSENNTISSNNVYKNGIMGIDIARSNNTTLISNSVYDNGQRGIYVSASNNSKFTSNNVYNNSVDYISYSRSSNITVNSMSFNGTVVSFTYLGDLGISSSPLQGLIPNGKRTTGAYINITNNSAGVWMLLNFSYTTPQTEGIVKNTLKMWHYDGSTWSVVNNSTVYSNYVSANLTDFSVFGLFGDPTTAGAGGGVVRPTTGTGFVPNTVPSALNGGEQVILNGIQSGTVYGVTNPGDIGLYILALTLGADASNASVLIKATSGIDTSSINGTVYKTYALSTLGISESAIQRINLEFVVTKGWMTAHGFNTSDIVFYTDSKGSWAPVRTTFARDDGTNYYFRVVLTDFSNFAIVGQNGGAPSLGPTIGAMTFTQLLDKISAYYSGQIGFFDLLIAIGDYYS